jgi:hypothetical protein
MKTRPHPPTRTRTVEQTPAEPSLPTVAVININTPRDPATTIMQMHPNRILLERASKRRLASQAQMPTKGFPKRRRPRKSEKQSGNKSLFHPDSSSILSSHRHDLQYQYLCDSEATGCGWGARLELSIMRCKAKAE